MGYMPGMMCRFGVEPYRYLADVIARIVDGHPNRLLDELLPWAYPATRKLKAVA
jgi:transposase